jgi:thiol:disulfide interchange protein
VLRLGLRPQWARWTPKIKSVGTALMVLASFYFLVPGIQLLRGSQDAASLKFPIHKYPAEFRGRPSVLDFRADWCAACLELEHSTFTETKVSEVFEKENFDYFQIDLTDQNAEEKKIIDQFEIVGLPSILFLNSKGAPCKDLSLFGFEEPASFLKRVERARRECL